MLIHWEVEPGRALCLMAAPDEAHPLPVERLTSQRQQVTSPTCLSWLRA